MHVSHKQAMKFLKDRSEEIGDCLVFKLKTLSINSTNIGKYYACSAANRLYHYLITGERPVSLKSTCNTPNCIRHWTDPNNQEKRDDEDLPPALKLHYAIIKAALKDGDTGYLTSKIFKKRMEKLDINPNKIIDKLRGKL